MWRNPVVHRAIWQALARVASTAVAFCAITLLVFVAFYAAPGSQFRRARPEATERNWHGYIHYVWRFVRHGDLGSSLAFRGSVTTLVFHAAPVTLSLLAGGLAIGLLFGLLPLLRPHVRVERALGAFAIAGVSLHPVWLSLVSSWLLGAHWHLLPAQGYCGVTAVSTGCSGISHWASHMVLPWLVVGVASGAYFLLAVRALLEGELQQGYVRAARAKGAGERRIVLRHVLRNVAGPLLALCVTNVGVLFSAAIFVETIFDLPGLGSTFRRSLLRHDLPLTAGVVLVVTLAILVLSLFADLATLVVEARPTGRQRRVAASPGRRVLRSARTSSSNARA